MSRARLRLAGAVSFASQVFGYVVGILFTAMVSRRLSERDFGAWAYIGTLISYAVTPTDLFSTWIYRDAARGRKILGSALILNAPILSTAILTYTAISNSAATSAGLEQSTLLLGLMVLPSLYLTTAITDIAKGYTPQHVGASTILYETTKLILGILLVAQLRLGLQGAFTTLAAAYTIQLAYLLTTIKPLASRKIDTTTIKRWLRGSIFKLISVASGYISQLDIILMTTITAATLITGYWQASLLIAVIVKSTGDLMGGLTQRLLSGGGQRDIDKSFTFTMTLAVPTLLGAVILSGDILYVFRPAYAAAWQTATILATSTFIGIITSFYSSIIFASDKFDLKEDTSITDFARSRVFTLWRIGLYTSIAYAAAIAATLLYLKSIDTDILTMTTAIAIIHLSLNTARLFIYSKLAQRYGTQKPRLSAAIPYLAAAIIMAIVVLIARTQIDPRAPTLAQTLPPLFSLIAIGAATYFTALWPLSKNFRDLVKDVKTFLLSYMHTKQKIGSG
jgi:O-antigen/teichoic acid export membrane protein